MAFRPPAWPLLVLALLAPAAGARAASFGVPPARGAPAPAGWFVLVGEDADAANNAFGDVTNELQLFIEVTGNQLEVCLFDPGIWSAAQPGLDFSFDTATPYSAFMEYALYEPGNPVPIALDDTSWGADTAASDERCVTFYNGPARPGVYRLVARMPDGPGVDQDVNLFGVETTPDYDAYAYHATVGHSNWTGATLASGAVRLHPWAAVGSRGRDASNQEVCGLGLVTWDLDGATSGMRPPDVTLATNTGWSDVLSPSLDGTFRLDDWPNMAPLDAAPDHGVYALEFSRLGLADGVVEANWPARPANFDFNAFSLQVWNLGQNPPFDFSEYPIVPPDPRMATRDSRRLYLPLRGGAPPVKEFLSQRVVNPPPAGDWFLGVTRPATIEISLANPTAYDLTNVSGRAVLNPAADLANPTGVQAAGGVGGTAAATGKTVDFSFAAVPAGTTATVTFDVDVTPSATGYLFLTGDGSDYMGGAAPTEATWDTPFAAGETGRPCAIEARVRQAPCAVTAAAAAPAWACLGETVALAGGGTTSVSCPGGLEYRWTGPGLPAPGSFGPPADASVVVTAPGPASFTLEARCAADPGCLDSDTVTVTVSSAPRAAADAGPDLVLGTCDVPFPIGTPGDPSSFDYLWAPAAPVSDPTLPQPDFIETAVGVYALTLTVTPRADPACAAGDDVRIEIVSGAPSGNLGNRLLARRSSGDVELTWQLGFVVPDRYNVHRATSKTDLDRTAYLAPVRSVGPVRTGAFTDSGAVAGPPDLYFYEVWGRDCAGQSVVIP